MLKCACDHGYRKWNQIVDWLENLSHGFNIRFHVLEFPPPRYGRIQGDLSGVSFFRSILAG